MFLRSRIVGGARGALLGCGALAITGASMVMLGGCALGSATAGHSLSAGTADDLKSDARRRIVEEAIDRAVTRANEHTDQKIAELRRDLGK